jgi:hypothetical protein
VRVPTPREGVARERPEGCSSDLQLERLLVDELGPGGERDALVTHLRTCARCQARRDELAAAPALTLADLASPSSNTGSNDSWLPPAPLAAAWPPAREKPRRARAGLFVGFAAAGLAAVLLLLPRRAEVPQTRTKGAAARLEMVARGADGRVFSVFEGTPLRQGDAVRFVVTTATTAHVAVVGLDAAGGVTIHFPPAKPASDAHASGPLPPGTHTLPGSVVLDATMGDERFVALACAAPVAREVLERAGARALIAASGRPADTGPLEVPCEQAGLSVRKVTP